MTLDSKDYADIRSGSQDLFSLDFMHASLYFVARTTRFFVIKFNCFVYDRYLPYTAAASCEVRD